MHEYGFKPIEQPHRKYDAVVLAVSHQEFLDLDIKSLLKDGGVLYDVKSVLPIEEVDGRL